MDSKEIEGILRELEDITRELDEVQKDITNELVDKISTVQKMAEQVGQREVILEKHVYRLKLKDNGETVFDCLW